MMRTVPFVVLIGLTLGLALPASSQELRTQQWIRDGQVVDIYVDEAGKIYKEMRYHGIIPAVRDEFKHRKRKRKGHAHVSWVGFQQKQFYSRVFVQTDQLRRFTITKPDPLHVKMIIYSAKVHRKNDGIRPIVTRQFKSAVEKIKTRRRGRNIEVTITLSKPVGYLYKQQGNYIFIDVER
jgi:hypothetical protein